MKYSFIFIDTPDSNRAERKVTKNMLSVQQSDERIINNVFLAMSVLEHRLEFIPSRSTWRKNAKEFMARIKSSLNLFIGYTPTVLSLELIP